jgi:hypothetical protein
MARGGKREGAGRKVGAPNKATQEAVENAKATGELPLDYMLRVMRDAEAEDRRRDAMATAAAQYLHSKLAAIEHSGTGGGPIQVNITGDDAGLL